MSDSVTGGRAGTKEANEQAMEKLTTGSLTAQGVLYADQTGFLDEIQENSELLNRVRTLTVNRDKTEINALGIGERIRVAQAEDTAAGDSVVVNQRTINIDTVKGAAYYYLTKELVEDNIEREQVARRIFNHVARQFSVDTQDLGINGDTASATAWLQQNDGWLKLAASQGMPTYDASGDGGVTPAVLDEDVFNGAIQTLDDKHWSDSMVFITSPQQIQRFRYGQTTRATPLGDAFLSGDADANPFGFDMLGVAKWPQNRMMFTDPQNLVYALYRELEFETMEQSDEIMARDLYAKYAVRVRDDYAIENPNAGVLVTNLADPTA